MDCSYQEHLQVIFARHFPRVAIPHTPEFILSLVHTDKHTQQTRPQSSQKSIHEPTLTTKHLVPRKPTLLCNPPCKTDTQDSRREQYEVSIKEGKVSEAEYRPTLGCNLPARCQAIPVCLDRPNRQTCGIKRRRFLRLGLNLCTDLQLPNLWHSKQINPISLSGIRSIDTGVRSSRSYHL